MTETILSTAAGQTSNERIQVALCHAPVGGSRIEIRQQSWADGLGWFTQSKVELSPEQLGELRGVLGGPSKRIPVARPSDGFQPRVIHAESA